MGAKKKLTINEESQASSTHIVKAWLWIVCFIKLQQLDATPPISKWSDTG